MQTFSKIQVRDWILLDYSAQKQVLQKKANFLEKKYGSNFLTFERSINESKVDNFEAWDDYIEWRAYHQLLIELLTKIEDIKHGDFQLT